jgi:hypothetical protein
MAEKPAPDEHPLADLFRKDKPELPSLPVPEFMETGQDPKGWDRASIALKTHPLHPFPRVTQEDFILPRALNKVKLVADALAIGASMAALAYFPLMLVGFMSTRDMTELIVGTLMTVALGTAALVCAYAIMDERAFRAELEA